MALEKDEAAYSVWKISSFDVRKQRAIKLYVKLQVNAWKFVQML